MSRTVETSADQYWHEGVESRAGKYERPSVLRSAVVILGAMALGVVVGRGAWALQGSHKNEVAFDSDRYEQDALAYGQVSFVSGATVVVEPGTELHAGPIEVNSRKFIFSRMNNVAATIEPDKLEVFDGFYTHTDGVGMWVGLDFSESTVADHQDTQADTNTSLISSQLKPGARLEATKIELDNLVWVRAEEVDIYGDVDHLATVDAAPDWYRQIHATAAGRPTVTKQTSYDFSQSNPVESALKLVEHLNR